MHLRNSKSRPLDGCLEVYVVVHVPAHFQVEVQHVGSEIHQARGTTQVAV